MYPGSVVQASDRLAAAGRSVNCSAFRPVNLCRHSARPIAATGLTNGTACVFTVTATNAAETGPPSMPPNAVTPAIGFDLAPILAMSGIDVVPAILIRSAVSEAAACPADGFAAQRPEVPYLSALPFLSARFADIAD